MAVAVKSNPFLPETDVEGLPKALLAEARKHKATNGVAKYAFGSKKGVFSMCGNTACHAGLGYPSISPDWVIGYLEKRPLVKEEVRRAFTEWLVNFSPFRSVFVTRDIDSIMKDEFAIVSVDHPQNLMAGALQAMRAMSEHSHASVIWYELVKNGVHPNLAFYLGYAFRTDGKVMYQSHSGHTGCTSPSCTSRETLVNFLMDKPVNLSKSTYRNSHSYSGAQNIFTKGSGDMSEIFETKIKKMLAGGLSVVNPFAKPKTDEKFDFVKGCAALAQLIKEEFKEELEKINGKA